MEFKLENLRHKPFGHMCVILHTPLFCLILHTKVSEFIGVKYIETYMYTVHVLLKNSYLRN